MVPSAIGVFMKTMTRFAAPFMLLNLTASAFADEIAAEVALRYPACL
jgi:hypothetical protein